MQYLSVCDDRFYIKIHDNCSTDGTVEALRKIIDNRLIVNYNDKNIGSVCNWLNSLSNCNSKYIIFVLDKDLVDINFLSEFIDYLEEAQPKFGYIDLDINKKRDIITTDPGKENVLRMCYLDKHPSGYFYDVKIYNEAFSNDLFQKIDKTFIFPFEVLNGVISVMYQSSIVVMPLIINAAIREKKDTRTLSFNESNIWFGEPKRFLEYTYYLDNALNLNLNTRDKSEISRKILLQAIGHVTYTLKSLLMNQEVCYHYYVNCRKISLKEMLLNEYKFLKYYYYASKNNISTISIFCNIGYSLILSVLRIIKSYR